MTTKLIATLSATAAAATALLSMSAPAQAFGFGTSGISFQQDTVVNFTFIQSRGANKSSLGIYSVSGNTLGAKVADLFSEKDRSNNFSSIGNAAAKADGYLGTAANLTGAAKVSFTFLANQVYTLGLQNQGWVGSWTRYSTTSLNPQGFQKAVFGAAGSQNTDAQAFAGVSSYQSANPFANGGITVSFEDERFQGDGDYNDFTIQAEAVPEPLTMGGLALGSAWLAYNRRRRSTKTA